MFDAEALEGSQIVPVAQLLEELLLDRPEAVSALEPELALNVTFEVVLDAIVIEQCVVHIYQKDNREISFGICSRHSGLV
jgi:hypothetical protein